MSSVHVGLNERSRYGYDVVVRNCDGCAPSWRDNRLQEERIARRPGQLASKEANGVLTRDLMGPELPSG